MISIEIYVLFLWYNIKCFHFYGYYNTNNNNKCKERNDHCQRHKVEAIQVTELMEVDTTSRGQQYFVIGNEMSVFISREMRERKSSGRLSRNNNRETISSCAICTIL